MSFAGEMLLGRVNASSLKYGVAAADDIRFSAILVSINIHNTSREDQTLPETAMRPTVRSITIDYIISGVHVVVFKNRAIFCLLGDQHGDGSKH